MEFNGVTFEVSVFVVWGGNFPFPLSVLLAGLLIIKLT